MATSTQSIYNLDPEHISCIGGRTVLTCQHCAGNAPRGSICTSCHGRGFNIYICAHCNPAAAASAVRASTSSTTTVSPATASTTPGSSTPSSPGSLSRTSSTSYPSHSETRDVWSWRRYGDGRGQTSCGRVEANTPRNL